jgi:hypothetical protein
MRHGVKATSLKNTYHRWTKGMITLNEAETPAERQIESDIQNVKALDLLRKTEIFLNDLHERQLYEAQRLASDGNLDEAENRIQKILGLKNQMVRVYESYERRTLAVIDAMRREKERMEQEKLVQANAVHVVDVKASVKDANEEQEALDALREISALAPVDDDSEA